MLRRLLPRGAARAPLFTLAGGVTCAAAVGTGGGIAACDSENSGNVATGNGAADDNESILPAAASTTPYTRPGMSTTGKTVLYTLAGLCIGVPLCTAPFVIIPYVLYICVYHHHCHDSHTRENIALQLYILYLQDDARRDSAEDLSRLDTATAWIFIPAYCFVVP